MSNVTLLGLGTNNVSGVTGVTLCLTSHGQQLDTILAIVRLTDFRLTDRLNPKGVIQTDESD